MTTRVRIGSLLAAAALLFAAGCNFDDAYRRYCSGIPECDPSLAGDGGAEDGGGSADGGAPDAGARIEIKSCGENGDCLARTEICDLHGHVCVPICHTAGDCPPGLTSCDRDGHSTFGVCHCTGAASCAQAHPGSTCSPIDHLCESLCASPRDCEGFDPPRFCDTTTGACLIEPIECTSNGQCRTAQRPRCDLTTNRCVGCRISEDCAARTDGLNDCDPSTGACVPFNTCDPAKLAPGGNLGPDTCRYGEVCVGTTCAPVDNGDCYGAVVTAWYRLFGGPVVSEALGTLSPTSDPDSECPLGGAKLSAEIHFYSPTGFTYPEDILRTIWFQGGAAGTPAQFADFVHDPPPSGAKYGQFTAGVCGVSALADDPKEWAVFLWDWDEVHDLRRAHGNAMCLH